MINLSTVLTTLGMTINTAKSASTRITKKANVAKTNLGMVSVEDAITAMTLAYTGEKNKSKFVEVAGPVIAKLQANDIPEEWRVPSEPKEEKESPFTAKKVLNIVVAYAEDKGLTEIVDLIKTSTASIEAERLAKKSAE